MTLCSKKPWIIEFHKLNKPCMMLPDLMIMIIMVFLHQKMRQTLREKVKRLCTFWNNDIQVWNFFNLEQIIISFYISNRKEKNIFISENRKSNHFTSTKSFAETSQSRWGCKIGSMRRNSWPEKQFSLLPVKLVTQSDGKIRNWTKKVLLRRLVVYSIGELPHLRGDLLHNFFFPHRFLSWNVKDVFVSTALMITISSI